MTGRGCAWLLLLAMILSLGLLSRAPAQQQASEYELKAAWIRRISEYVTWPEQFAPAGPNQFVICIVGKDPLGSAVRQRLGTLMVLHRQVVVYHSETLAECKPCHVLFLTPQAAGAEEHQTPLERLAAARKRLNGSPTLLIADSAGLARKGAMIGFYLEEKRVKFEINHVAVKQAGLSISSNLLNIAKIVEPDRD